MTTLGKDDPVGELNRSLWNSGRESDKDIARKQKRKLSYYANVYVVKDSSNPENEGGVFLYKFGKKIFDKITASMQPEFEDEEPINPFDFWKGADDAKLEEIYNKIYDLSEFTAEDQFKPYEALKTRLDTVLGTKLPTGSLRYQDPEVADEDNHREVAAPVDEELEKIAAAATNQTTEEEDDALSYFQQLAES